MLELSGFGRAVNLMNDIAHMKGELCAGTRPAAVTHGARQVQQAQPTSIVIIPLKIFRNAPAFTANRSRLESPARVLAAAIPNLPAGLIGSVDGVGIRQANRTVGPIDLQAWHFAVPDIKAHGHGADDAAFEL